MKQLYSFLVNRHQDIFRALLVITSITLVTYFFPRTGSFKYEFEEGRPWKYEDLIADFNFAIYKSDAEIDYEKEQLLKNEQPYYRMDDEIMEMELAKLPDQMNLQFVQLRSDTSRTVELDSLSHLLLARDLLTKIYMDGVIRLKDEHENLKGDNEVIVLQGNIAKKRSPESLFTIESARKYIASEMEEKKQYSALLLRPVLERSLTYNVYYDDSTTQKVREENLAQLSLTRGMVQQGESIIEKGNIVTTDKFQVLSSYRDAFNTKVIGSRQSNVISLGYFILIGLIMALFTAYIYIFHKEVLLSQRKFLFVLVLIVSMISLVSVLVKEELPVLYAIPFCIVPIVLRTFFGTTLALYAHLTVVLISSFLIPYGPGFVFMQIAAGIVAIFGNIKAKYWSQFFTSSAIILLTYFVSYFALTLIQEGNFMNIEFSVYGWLTVNVFLTLLAYPLIPIFEKLFGFVSGITLVEYSDLNKPLLKRLSLEAPGTFQHSLQVSNLAEAASSEIGANSLLVKVGSLYHDVGKLGNPLFFIENQNTGVNPHDDLSYSESAKIIISHVPKGIEIAKKSRLPDQLIDFIRTHHGTNRVEYFYRSQMKSNPDAEINEDEFRYPGPLPFSKETAILMMADAIEAASRSLVKPTSISISVLVDKMIKHLIDQEQFVNSSITFKEITICKKVFKKMLNSIYHARIEYPEEVHTGAELTSNKPTSE